MFLRPLSKGDEEKLLEIFTDPIAMEFYLGTKTLKDAEEYVARAEERYRTRKMGFFVCELKETGEFLGLCGLLPQNPDGTDEIEVGYLFARKHWGHGYATEAAKACMEYGFETLGLKRIISLIDPDHKKSIAIAERNGLKLEKETFYKGRKALVFVLERR